MPLISTEKGDIWIADHQPTHRELPLVLLHGAGGTHRHWHPTLRHSTITRVIAPDLPGHGNTPGTGRSTITEYAHDILALLDALEISQAYIGGHSMGGAIAQQLALDAPDRVAGLLLVSTAAKMSVHPDILNGLHRDLDQVVTLLMTWIWGGALDEKTYSQGFAQLKASGADVLFGDFTACNQFDLRARLGEIRSPALVIGGGADRMIPVKYTQALAEALPHAQMQVIPDGGHMVMLQAPDAVNAKVEQWLLGLR